MNGKVLKLNIEAISPEKMVNISIEPLKEQIHDKQLQLKVTIKPGLPNVSADTGKICWILVNLISNSVRYTPRWGEIEVGAEAAGKGFIRFYVHDTGSGMSQKDVSRVFDSLVHRQDGALPQGLGLALSLSKEIVEAHGGTIEAKSEPGLGSKFSFSLPVV